MGLTKTILINKINEYLEERWRSITREVPKYTFDADGNRTTTYITLRNDETLDEEYQIVSSDADALLTAIISSLSDAIIELIKSEGIDIGESTADKMEVE